MAVKAATSLEQVLKHYDVLSGLRASGNSLRGVCPLHKGTNPKQFSVTLAKNAWNCFSDCQSGGNHLDFVMKMEGCTLREAAWKLNDWFDLGLGKQASAKVSPERRKPENKSRERHRSQVVPEELDKTVAEPEVVNDEGSGAGPEVNVPLSFCLENLDPAHHYLVQRALFPSTIAEFGLGYCSKGILVGRIAIPIHNDSGQLVAYAGRWPGEPPEGKEKYRLPAKFHKSTELFNFHRADKEPSGQPLIVVEGYFAAMRLWQEGSRRVVALLGSSLSRRQEELIARLAEVDPRVLLMLDDDEAGKAAQREILPRLANHCYVSVYRYPDAVTQPDRLPEEAFALLRA